jgi:hypothetical protein
MHESRCSGSGVGHSIKVQNKEKIQEQFTARDAVLVWPEIHVNNIHS